MAAASDFSSTEGFVLDGSVALSWCFPDEASQRTQRVLTSLHTARATVPTLWFLEVSNAMISAEKRGRITQAQIAEAMNLLGQLPLDVDQRSGFTLIRETMALARDHALTTYDAAYLELALHLSLPLATLDKPLQKAARSAGIEVYAA